jgi:hypothetical protein
MWLGGSRLRLPDWGRLVDQLYHSARKICGGLDLNDAISRRYGFGPTECASSGKTPLGESIGFRNGP